MFLVHVTVAPEITISLPENLNISSPAPLEKIHSIVAPETKDSSSNVNVTGSEVPRLNFTVKLPAVSKSNKGIIS
jgi:hypothetical protein